MRVVQTPWGWRFMRKYVFGSNLKAEIKEWEMQLRVEPGDSPSVIAAKNNHKSFEVNRLIEFSKKCKLKLD